MSVQQINKFHIQVWITAAMILSLLILPQRVIAQETEETILPESPSWLEPRGIGVTDLVGLVPESHLRNAIINFDPTVGMMQYIEGRREGDTVTIRAKVSQRFDAGTQTLTNCLGHRAIYDHWAITAPASEMRIFDGSRDITRLVGGFWYFPAGQIQPIDDGSAHVRYYEKRDSAPRFTSSGALLVPANMGCVLFIAGRHTNMTAEFKIKVQNKIEVQVLGSETFNFHSYIGPGYAGQFGSIAGQMGRFGGRHEKWFIHPPVGTEFLFVKTPPMDVSPSSVGDQEANAQFPSSGTYRLSAGTNGLSTDYQAAMAIPLYGQFLDVDIAGGSYLAKLSGINMIAAPEYFVPPGFTYNPCFKYGGCPDSLLEAMNASTSPTTIYYYSIKRVERGLDRIPLRQVGSSWRPGVTENVTVAGDEFEPNIGADISALPDGGEWVESQTLVLPNVTPKVFLPAMGTLPPPPPKPIVEPDDPNGCPCGWFDKDGRMLDFIAGN